MARRKLGGIWAACGLAAGIGLCLVLLCATASAQASTPLATVSAETPLSGGSGWLVWSVPVSGGWGLEGYHDGALAPIPAAPRPAPFDASVGTDAAGQPVAVFSRCSHTPTMFTVSGPEPELGGSLMWPSSGKRCRIHEIRLPSGKETALPIPAGSHTSDTTPSISAGRVAFARIAPGHGKISQVMLFTPGHPGGLRTLRHGVVPACHFSRSACDREPPTGEVQALSFDGRIVAFDWAVEPSQEIHLEQELRVDSVSPPTTNIAAAGFISEACTSGGFEDVRLEPPVTTGDSVLAGSQQQYECYGRFTSRLVRRRGARRPESGPLAGNVLGLAADEGGLYALVAPKDSVQNLYGPSCAPATPCAIEQIPMPALTPERRLPTPPYP